MKKSLLLFVLITSLSMSSCRPKYNPDSIATTFNNYDNTLAYTKDQYMRKQLGTDNPYSGTHYNELDSANQFGIMFNLPFKDISTYRISNIRVSAQCRVNKTKLSKTTIVCHIHDSLGNSVHWQGQRLNIDVIRGDSWSYIEKFFSVFEFSKQKSNKLHVYFWTSDSKEQIDIDDFKIEFY